MFEPDPVQMRRHVGHLFEGWLDGCQEGRIELAWTDGRDGKLKHAAVFGTDELDELVDRAVTENRKPGQNVYIGQALRHPDIAPFGRGKDDEFFALTAYYVDIDDDVTATASISYRTRSCPPTGVVITGRHPHLRAQMLWRLDAPVRDPDRCRLQNAALAHALEGDPSVINPSRVLRLGGSIAWPLKDGRVIEPTEFLVFDDGRPKAYMPEQIARAFPPALMPTPGAQPSASTVTAATANASSGLQIGTTSVSVEDCMARIRSGDHWHDNMLRLVGHWVARGWSDTEILTAAEAMTLPGYAVADTRRDVARMIHGGRTKWATPDATHQVDEPVNDERPAIIDPRSWAGKQVPERKWLVENWVPMDHVTALYGDGGLGKTLLAQQLLTSVATGKEWLGLPVRKCRAFGLLCEDHEDDLHINQERINLSSWIDYADLGDLRLWPSVGFDNLLMTFDGHDAGKGLLTAFFQQLLDEILAFGARFVVLDTAADLFGGNENVRTQVRQFVANACGRIAREIDGAVLLCAHPSVSGMASGAGSSGSTAWNNTVRSRLYLTQAPSEDGEEADPDVRVLTRKKANYARTGEMLTLRWNDGVMVPVAAGSGEGEPSVPSAIEMLKHIEERWKQKNPFSASPQSDRYVVPVMGQRMGLSHRAAKALLGDWLANELVRSEVADSHSKARGLRVLTWPM